VRSRRGVPTPGPRSPVTRHSSHLPALYVLDRRAYQDAPESVRDDLRESLDERDRRAVSDPQDRVGDGSGTVITASRKGRPADEIVTYAREVDADVVTTGTRGDTARRDGYCLPRVVIYTRTQCE